LPVVTWGSLGSSFCINCSLYGYNCKRFLRKVFSVDSDTCSGRLALHTDLLWLRTKHSGVLSAVSSGNIWSFCATLPVMTDIASVAKLFVPPSDWRRWRTTTSKLQWERPLNGHNAVTSREFKHTPTRSGGRAAGFVN
jgi:hypothetical protein